MLDKLRYLKSIGSDQLIFLMGLFFVILAIMILRYTLKHPRLGAEGKHKIMRIGLFISIAALAFCGVCYCEDFVMPNSTRCKCNFMDYLRRKRWRRIRRIFR